MVDVAVTILQVLVEVRDVAEGIQENDEQARRLSERVIAIEPTVLAVKNGQKRLSPESLRQLLETVEKIKAFLDGYKRTTKLTRVWKRRSNAGKFKDFSFELSEGRQALQLDVLVDVWAKEDASDRLGDIENLKDEMKRKQRNSTDNRAEFTRAVKVSMGGDPISRRRSHSPACRHHHAIRCSRSDSRHRHRAVHHLQWMVGFSCASVVSKTVELCVTCIHAS